jgi:hypothetical protein
MVLIMRTASQNLETGGTLSGLIIPFGTTSNEHYQNRNYNKKKITICVIIVPENTCIIVIATGYDNT